MNRKLTAFVLAFCTAAALCSCGNSKNTESSLPEKNAAEQSEAVNTETTETPEGEVTEVTAAEEDKVEVSYDFSGLASENAVKILTSEKYHIKFRYVFEKQEMYQEIYYYKGDSLSIIEIINTEYSVLYRPASNEKYTILGDVYSKSEPESDEASVIQDMFLDYGYTGSGETEIDGKKYSYDEFYQEADRAFTKFIMNDEGKLYAIQSAENTIYIEECDDDFDPAEVIALSDDMKELSSDEFNTVFMEEVLGNTEAVSVGE